MPILSGSKKLVWTAHSRSKMRHYKLSEQRARRVINLPKRVEDGIAPKTVAMMQQSGSKKHPYEIWVMFQDSKLERKIISVWRYPGITKAGDSLPPEILDELRKIT